LKDISSHVSDPKSLPIKGIRKIIADRMIKSLAETAQYTLNASAPVSKLQNLRHRLNVNLSDESKSASISVNDLILFAVSRVLPDFTFMNAHKIGDNLSIIEEIHLGMAVDTPRGLMVPVIRHANLLSLPEISLESKRLSAACKNGNIKTFELTGSTFTVTNLGRFGITSFTPILNTPEVAILGVCGIEMKPVPHTEINKCTCGCSMNFEPQIGFSLTINHQAVDGAPAARFLKALCDTAAKIDSLVTEN
jgi:pyruvate dehydrogenase E2 component (dihydrolipoamide acetyltransferase)